MSVVTLKEKIDNFFRDYVEIEPSVTVSFDPLTLYPAFTFKLFKIGPNPNRWSRLDEERLEKLLKETIGEPLDEYRKLLLEELGKKSEKQITQEIKEVSVHLEELPNDIQERLDTLKESIDWLVEDPCMSVEEFASSYLRQMPDSRFTEDEKLFKFVGREDDIKELFSFLEDEDERIRLITGDGGIGKTRLALEFARRLEKQGKWNIYFINHFRPFRMRQYFRKPTLLILDEPSRHSQRQKIFSEVFSVSVKSKPIKLLLLDRTVFKETLMGDIRGEELSFQGDQDLKAGNISEFLKTNYSFLDKEKREQVVELSENSFVFAQLFAEYTQETGELANIKVVLDHTIDRAVNMYCTLWEDNSPSIKGKIKRTFELISLVQPIGWPGVKKLLKNTLVEDLISILEKIITFVRIGNRGLVVRDEGGFVLRPDPVADYIRLKLIYNETQLSTWFNDLLAKQPLFISLNIPNSIRLGSGADRMDQVLGDIWNRLNRLETNQPDYFAALVFFTGNLNKAAFFNIDCMNPEQWFKTYQNLPDRIQDQPVREALANSLLNAVYIYGSVGNFPKMERVLNTLRELYEENQEDQAVQGALVKGLVNGVNGYGKNGNLREMDRILENLKKLYRENHDDRMIREVLANGLVNGSMSFGKANNFSEMGRVLVELRGLYEEDQDDQAIQRMLVIGLHNAVYYYGTAVNIPKMEKVLDELRDLYEENRDNREVREKLLMGLVNGVKGYGKAKEFSDMERVLEELREFCQEDYNSQVVQNVLANGLLNAMYYYGNAKSFQEMERILREFRDLYEEDRDNKEMREMLVKGLLNATDSYGLASKLTEMEGTLEELRSLYKNHREDNAVLERLAKGLFNAINGYGKADNIPEMERILDEIRDLYEDHLDDPVVQEAIARSFDSAVYFYGRAEKLYEMKNVLEELRVLNKAGMGNQVLREWLASSIYNTALIYLLYQKDTASAKAQFDDLLSLYQTYPDDESVNGLVEKLIERFREHGINFSCDDDR